MRLCKDGCAPPAVPCLESGPCWKHLLPLASTCHFCARAHNMPLCWLWTKLVATPCSRDTQHRFWKSVGFLARIQGFRMVGLGHSDMPAAATCQEDQLRCRRPRHRMSKPTGGCLGHILRASQSGVQSNRFVVRTLLAMGPSRRHRMAKSESVRLSHPVTMFLPCAFWIFLSLKACKSGWHFACPASGFRAACAAQQLSSQTRTMSRFQAFWTKMLDHVRP